MLWWVINSFKRDCSTLYRDNNGRTFTSPDGPAKWPQADGKTPMILQNKWRIYWIQNLLKIRSKIRIRKSSFETGTDSGWVWIDHPCLELKKEHLSLEDEISSYLPDQKMENSSGEKPKRDNEEYYEEIEALGRFLNWCFLDGARW